MDLTPEIVVGVALGAAALYGGGVLWSHYRQRVAAAKLLMRKEPPITEPEPMKAAVNRTAEFSYRAEKEQSKPTRRPIGASAESRRQPVPGSVQAFRSSPDDSARRRREDEDRRNDDLSTLAILAATQPAPVFRSEPQCSPSYDDSSSRSSSSGSCSGSWGGSSDSSSSSSSSDSGSCSSGCD